MKNTTDYTTCNILYEAWKILGTTRTRTRTTQNINQYHNSRTETVTDVTLAGS